MTTYSRTTEFEGATFVRASFKGATVRFSDVSRVTMRGVDVDGLDIDSHDLMFGTLIVNGVDVVPLVEAELNRQFPGRELQKAQTPEGLRDGWVAVQAAWATTVANTPPGLVDAHVEDEWSLAQTLRHLVLATDAWLRGAILRTPQPFHELGQIFTGAEAMGFDMSIFRVGPPTYDEILAVRAERQQMVTDFLATATTELLAEERDNPWGGGDWHPTVGDCVRVILEEEWAHLRYVRRDLALLRASDGGRPPGAPIDSPASDTSA
ncbi:DinB family protein [Cellulomonas sp. S1-8]|uniref:DinB family protein n=1 Tax=Cellulomonas sp. S1-8 TaxID=2904790 RepID=UPI002244460B|nr:DinB family protein [Cellulomonas sp. S1-8]UZN04199.1 DinB family protein [Cellulomonas sp. S1-8]